MQVRVNSFGGECEGSVAKLENDLKSKLNLNSEEEIEKEDEERINLQEEVEEEEEEFTFVCTNPDGSPVSADDIFVNGQIRPVFPLFNRDLLLSEYEEEEPKQNEPPLKKLFIKESEHVSSSGSEPDGPFCKWNKEACGKSNSTGFSKLRRFRELMLRSNSDGNDFFVFLHHKEKNDEVKKATNKKEEKKNETVSSKGKMKGSSAHEKLYVRNRAIKEEHKRKSYLPYRVGFFANASGLSRNVHPY